MVYYCNRQSFYLLLFFILKTTIVIKAEDLLDQYVQHVQLVNDLEDNSSDLVLVNLIDSDLPSFSDKSSEVLSAHSRHVRTRRDIDGFNSEIKQSRTKRESDIVWTHSITLDDDGLVTLRWQPRHQEILFRVEARTLGYVGVGFSPNGGMDGADIVLGWVDDKMQKPVLLVRIICS